MSNRKRAEAKSKTKNAPAPSKGTKRKRGRGADDDTPRAFKRLMAFTKGQTKRSGLDDGVDKSKGSKAAEKDKPEKEGAVPSIRPGESLSDFAARVDASIPVAGLINKTKGGKDPLGLKQYRTRKEKKMHKLYEQWRAEERKIQERKEEELELAAERELENGMLWSGADGPRDWDPVSNGGKGKKKRKRGGKGAAKDEEDPWEELRRKRGEGKVRLGDVAQAPPSLQKVSAKLPINA